MDLHRKWMKRLRKIFKVDVKFREQNMKPFVSVNKQFLVIRFLLNMGFIRISGKEAIKFSFQL